MSGSPPNKRTPIDRLSSLPDSLLILVLSFLGVKKATVTSVLSKRWRFLWSQLPSLAFREDSEETEKISQFVSMVNRTLRIRRVHLEKLDVYLKFDESLAPDVDSWVDFVSQNKTQDFSLMFMFKLEGYLYEPPETMYSNPSLMRLSLSGCFMDTTRPIEWQSLTYLFIKGTELPQHVIENVLSSCQVLHTLILVECCGYERLRVTSRCLHRLKVHDIEGEENGPLLEISAPTVRELDITFEPLGRILQLKNMTSLVEASVDFTDYSFRDSKECMDTAKEIYETIHHVKDLSLGRNYFKAISESVVNGWKIPISRRSFLTLSTDSEDEHNITGITAILESSPILETFSITSFLLQEETWDEAAKGDMDLDCNLLHLKTVELTEFAESISEGDADPFFDVEPMITVARAILKRAPALEEMVVRVRFPEMSDYIVFCRALLACPRSSAKAVVRFC